MNLIWSPFAIQKFEEILDYISIDSHANADRFAEKVFQKIALLIELPNIGRKVPELNNSNYRELIFGNYRIIYKILQQDIHILTIRHFKRLLDTDEIEKI
jgi:plasmid stabilization system protein ParE